MKTLYRTRLEEQKIDEKNTYRELIDREVRKLALEELAVKNAVNTNVKKHWLCKLSLHRNKNIGDIGDVDEVHVFICARFGCDHWQYKVKRYY